MNAKNLKTEIFYDFYDGRYFGSLVNGKRSGFGVCINDKMHYEGEWRNDKSNGKGVCNNTKDGYQYSGEWENGRKSGQILVCFLTVMAMLSCWQVIGKMIICMVLE